MGAAVGVEIGKPIDASDVNGNLNLARNEVIRLRMALGHLAKRAGFSEVVYDASDLVLGQDENSDLERCVSEVIHIRSALQLATASDKRRQRGVVTPAAPPRTFFDHMESGSSDNDSSSGDEHDDVTKDCEEPYHDHIFPSAQQKANISNTPLPPTSASSSDQQHVQSKHTPPPPRPDHN